MNLISPLKHSFYMIRLSCVISDLDNKLIFYQSVLFVIAALDLASLGTLLFYLVF